ncbi:MAG: DUF4838 domain-containing protein [Candidatus Hydrogenedentales bacterium]|jgi:hypothetical protein
MHRIVPLLIALFLPALSFAEAQPWLASGDYSSIQMVVSPNATVAEQEAAKVFAEFWERCTGKSAVSEKLAATRVPVYVGRSSLTPEVDTQIDWDALKGDGVYLRSFDAPRALVVAGGNRLGTVYAAYEFFERYFGVRWLAPGVVHVPPAPADLGRIEYQYTPPFVHRRAGLPEGADPDTYRNASIFTFGIYGHSLYKLVPPEEHFASHPEYYSEIGGKRIAAQHFDWHDVTQASKFPSEAGQLCMSNPEVARVIADAIVAMAKEKPEANAWSVCQMDWGNNCACANCRAIDEREGTPMGSLLTGVNRVAENIEKELPGHFIHTYAYTHTRKPPRTLKPRANVLIHLCSLEADYARPLNDPESRINGSYARDVAAWAAITNNLLIYNYPLNAFRHQLPRPMLHVLGPNMRFFADAHPLGVYEQGGAGKIFDFGYLKPYVLSKLLWDPYADSEAIQKEFVELYYGKAAPHIFEYIAYATKFVREKRVFLSIFDKGGWIDREFVTNSDAILKKALAAAESEEIRKRVDLVYLTIQLASLVCNPEVKYGEDTLTMTRQRLISAEAYVERLKQFEIRLLGEYIAPEEAIESYGGPDVATTPIVRLRNDRYEIIVAPEFSGSILRFHDTKTGVELLRGHEDCGVAPGTWQDWTNQNAMGEQAVAKTYRVVEKDEKRAVIEAATQTGLTVRRTMRLTDDERFEVTIALTNTTDKPLSAMVKSHPEFDAQCIECVPEIWIERDGTWARLNEGSEYDQAWGFGFEEPNGARRWGFRANANSPMLVCEFEPGEIETLMWYHDTSASSRQVNLELIPPRTELAPGESRSFTARYSTTRKNPPEL